MWQGKVNHNNFFLHNSHRASKYSNEVGIPVVEKNEWFKQTMKLIISVMAFWRITKFIPAEVAEGRCPKVVLIYASSRILTMHLPDLFHLWSPCTLDAWMNSAVSHRTLEWLNWFSYCPKTASLLIISELRGEKIKKKSLRYWHLNDLTPVIASLQR